MISKRLKNEERNCELIKTKERDKIFGELNIYITKNILIFPKINKIFKAYI
jgi:hypothetical protein